MANNKINSKTDDALYLKDVCKLLSISEATCKNWVRLGKLPYLSNNGTNLSFKKSDIDRILHDVDNGTLKILNKRRNKKKINGFFVYKNYVTDARSIDFVNKIINNKLVINEEILRATLANFALQFIFQKQKNDINKANMLLEYLNETADIGKFKNLIDDLLGDKTTLSQKIDINSDIFNYKLFYTDKEDILGFIYISLKNINQKKSLGMYYTPPNVVKYVISHIMETTNINDKIILDPCCGSGNFILNLGRRLSNPKNLFGQDIDLISIQLTRINFALKFDVLDTDTLYSHFICADTLTYSYKSSYDIIIGNPPWGGKLNKEQIQSLSLKYNTLSKYNSEIYDLFIERSLSLLSDGGILSFVLPLSILNARMHNIIRDIIIKTCNFKFVRYLGETFNNVQCPSIILGVEKSKNRVTDVNITRSDNETHTILSNRQITSNNFNFHIKDEIQDCLDKIDLCPNATRLLGNAKFALGVITGNNQIYISNTPQNGCEPIIRGCDIGKYKILVNKYINFLPQNFQQVAPIEIYRAPEKLFYRFICNNLVFAYDDKQMLSLNSCNILIPQIPDTNIKYILAILNSRVANFYFVNMFNSIKVLRSHIEQIPIPKVSLTEQERIINIVDKIIANDSKLVKYYNMLDEYIMSLYSLDAKTYKVISDFFINKNLFI
ncbi:MAG: N-6 DNA methylase [Rickettsiales bacterium]|jgi:tRNA G10  N-methylase Trm11|nr:N-6 DNA methylase [Rickettsiales bacterium]